MLCFPLLSVAQASLDKEVFLDSLKFETTSPDYTYSRVIKNYNTIQNEYLITDYYKSGQIQMTGKSTHRDDLVKKGFFTYYFENGNRNELVHYENSVKVGPYFSWYPDGKEKIIGEYLKNPTDVDTEGLLKINQFWDTGGTQKVTDGSGFYEDVEDPVTVSSGKLKKGLKDSIWNGHSKRLQVTFTEEYKDGILVFGTSTDAQGVTHNYKNIETEAKPLYGAMSFRSNFLKKVLSNFKSMKTEYFGKSLVLSFYVEKDGYIREVNAHRGINPEIDNRVITLLKSADKWIPGISRGVNTRKKYFLPINMPHYIPRN